MRSGGEPDRIGRDRRFVRSLAVLAVLAVGLVSAPAATATQSRTYPIRHVADGLGDLFIAEFSTAGPYALLSDGQGFFHAQLDTGSIKPIDFDDDTVRPRVLGPTYAYAPRLFQGPVFDRQHRDTGVIERLSPPITAFANAEPVSSSTDSRYLMLSVSDFMNSLSSQRHLLYDAETNALLSSEATGLDPGGHPTTAAQVSNDGGTVLYTRRLPSGVRQQVLWDRVADTRSVADAPHPNNDYSISPNLQWAIWPEATTVGGVQQTPLMRKNLTTGETVIVGNDDPFYDNKANFVLDDGRVVYVSGEQSGLNLYLWSGPGQSSTQLNVSATGAPADAGINFFLSNFVIFSDGSRAFFTSFATNLTDGTPTSRKRIYELRIADVAPPSALGGTVPTENLKPARRLSLG